MKKYVVYGAAHEGFGETTARTLLEAGNHVIGLYDSLDQQNAIKLKNEKIVVSLHP